MRPAPLAVLAQRDAIGVVALALVRLVVAPLALLAGEGDSDAHVSAGHTPLRGEMWVDRRSSGQKNDPPRASRFECRAHHQPALPPKGRRTVVWGVGTSGGRLPAPGEAARVIHQWGVCVGARAQGVSDALLPPRRKVTARW